MLRGKVTFSKWVSIFCMILSCGCYQCVYGQQVLWLFMRPQISHDIFSYGSSPQGHYYGTVDSSYSNSRSIDNGGSTFLIRNFFHKNRVHDQSYSGPLYQRPTSKVFPPPPIQHLLINEDGSASDIIWQQHDSKRKNKVNKEPEPVNYENDKVFLHNDQVVRKEDDEYGDSSGSASNGSGSTEFSVVRHPFQDDDNKPTASVNGNVRCAQPHLEGNQARYDPVTGRCFTVGHQGPCGNLMVFTAAPGDSFTGVCSCDYDSFDRPMVPVGGQCHFLYTQAVCHPGYWLTSVTQHLDAVCELNPCYNSYPSLQSSKSRSIHHPIANQIVYFKGDCLPLNSPSRHCRREGEVVLFAKGSSELSCGFNPKSTKRISRRQISNIRMFRCRPGETRSRVTKKCVRQKKMYFVGNR